MDEEDRKGEKLWWEKLIDKVCVKMRIDGGVWRWEG